MSQDLILLFIGVTFGLLLLYIIFASEESYPEQWTTELLYTEFTPYEFESIVTALWDSKGYTVRQSKKGPDGGIDVEATKPGVSVAIEVKQYNESNRVGRQVVQKAYAASQQYNFSKAVIATTSDFTSTAEEARDSLRSPSCSIELYDGEKLVAELNESSLEPETFLKNEEWKDQIPIKGEDGGCD